MLSAPDHTVAVVAEQPSNALQTGSFGTVPLIASVVVIDGELHQGLVRMMRDRLIFPTEEADPALLSQKPAVQLLREPVQVL